MQNADGLDAVEGPPDRAEIENVGLGVFDILQRRFPGLASGIGKARPTDVDRENGRLRPSLSDVKGVLTGTASSDENVGCRRRGRGAAFRRTAGHGQEIKSPARVRVLAVLLHDLARRGVVDTGQRRDRATVCGLFERLGDLLGQEIDKVLRAAGGKERLRPRQTGLKDICRYRSQQERRRRVAGGDVRRQPLAQVSRFLGFTRAFRIDVFVDETLLGQRAEQRDDLVRHRSGRDVLAQRQVQQRKAQVGQQKLQLDAAQQVGLHRAAQQNVVGKGRNVADVQYVGSNG